MYRLFTLSAIYFLYASALPRSPKIYNVLISTKKNLSPSHALPVYEPVLRAAPLGFALPPILTYQTYQPKLFEPNFVQVHRVDEGQPVADDGTQPLPLEQFIPYGANTQGFYNNPQQPQNPFPNAEPDDPKTIVANLKKNTGIPDVPPPNLPVRNPASA